VPPQMNTSDVDYFFFHTQRTWIWSRRAGRRLQRGAGPWQQLLLIDLWKICSSPTRWFWFSAWSCNQAILFFFDEGRSAAAWRPIGLPVDAIFDVVVGSDSTSTNPLYLRLPAWFLCALRDVQIRPGVRWNLSELRSGIRSVDIPSDGFLLRLGPFL
jgi:hypothetical protein